MKMNAVLDRPTSYEELYGTYYGEVLHLCCRLLSNRHEAEEVTQEVFLKLYREYQALGQTDSMVWRPWVIKVSVNACRDRRRSGWWKWWRGTNSEGQETEYPSPNHTPEEMLLSRETQRHIWHALRELSGRQQEVFVLRHLEEWSTEEVAKILEMTTGSVKRHLFRAVHRLRRELGDRL
ncbi:MAG: RNA polymerase sigma factor [Candidatus Binatia bacterium]